MRSSDTCKRGNVYVGLEPIGRMTWALGEKHVLITLMTWLRGTPNTDSCSLLEHPLLQSQKLTNRECRFGRRTKKDVLGIAPILTKLDQHLSNCGQQFCGKTNFFLRTRAAGRSRPNRIALSQYNRSPPANRSNVRLSRHNC
jgi:hypothetical protein